jgi:tRNA-specific 2-thiouridylase
MNLEKEDKRIVVGVSGGVDSMVALLLLKEQGYTPIAVSLALPIWDSPKNIDKENACCTIDSLNLVSITCKSLEIEHHIYDVKQEFKDTVVKYFLKELKNGRVPNPCIHCNLEHKLKHIIQWADVHGINKVATGHFASKRYNKVTKKYELLEPRDKFKDQTYMLSMLPQEWIKRLEFPVSKYTKEEVCLLAGKHDLDVFVKKKQSQDFCFAHKSSLTEFIKESLGENPGPIYDEEGRYLGQHKGLWFYIRGQRKGLGFPEKYFVKDFNKDKNIVYVTKERTPILTNELIVNDYSFISGNNLLKEKEIKLKVKIRYGQEKQDAIIYPDLKNKQIKVVFKKEQKFVLIGQFCVFYKGKVCLGGGIIDSLK